MGLSHDAVPDPESRHAGGDRFRWPAVEQPSNTGIRRVPGDGWVGPAFINMAILISSTVLPQPLHDDDPTSFCGAVVVEVDRGNYTVQECHELALRLLEAAASADWCAALATHCLRTGESPERTLLQVGLVRTELKQTHAKQQM